MESVYFWIFTAMCAGTIAYGLAKPERFFEYPYFMAGIFAVFILPQAISLLRFPGAAHPEAVNAVLLMTNLCLGACLLGYLIPPNRWIAKHASTPVNLDKLFHFGVLFILSGYFFGYLISRMTPEETGGSMWTGKVTIYGFFANLAFPGMSIALMTAMTRGGAVPWAVAALGVWPTVAGAIFAGRREQAALFMLTVGLTLFYQRRLVPPRALVAGALGFALLAIPATGSYRSAMSEQNLEAVKSIDLIGNFEKFLNEESILELRNAAMIIDAAAYMGDYEYGGGYWDQLVFRFVPAQLLGKDFKEGLMFRSTNERADQEMEAKGFQISVGSTLTGMGDSFQQFGYFGCGFFLLLAVIFRTLWLTSLQPSAFFAQLLYIQTSTSAMRAVTHQTVDYLPGLVYNVIFLGLAVWYARERAPESTARGVSVGRSW
jgi:hypothetical protein